jgi:hypothetical protein
MKTHQKFPNTGHKPRTMRSYCQKRMRRGFRLPGSFGVRNSLNSLKLVACSSATL